MDSAATFVLVHSPLVGPLTWGPVAKQIRQRRQDVVVPAIEDSPGSTEPFWKQHAGSIARALTAVPAGRPLVLAGHSGAGPLLPAIRQLLENPVQTYLFVDAGIPRAEATRLDLMKWEDPEWSAQFQAELARGERYPAWTVDDLREVIPDELLRRQMAAELRPRGLDFFSEPIPVFEGWPDAPCAYIQLSSAYERPASYARQAGWPTYRIEAGHFHMLVDPAAVTDLLIKAVAEPGTE